METLNIAISEAMELLRFSFTTISQVYKSWFESNISVGRNCLSNVTHQKIMCTLVQDGGKGTLSPIVQVQRMLSLNAQVVEP